MSSLPCLTLYFPSADLPEAASRTRCKFLRRAGLLLHLPSLAAPPDTLTALPVGLILLHLAQAPAGLPAIASLRAAFPAAVVLTLVEGDLTPRWRLLHGTDGEIIAPTDQELADFLRAQTERHCQPAIGCDIVTRGIWLPAQKQAVYLRGTPLPLSPNERILLSVLCRMTPCPVSPDVLAGFIRQPASAPPRSSVSTCICAVNRKASALGIPRLIRFAHPQGYVLTHPYCLPQ